MTVTKRRKTGQPQHTIEILRQRANISQIKLSEALGITDHTYRNWIKGRSEPTLTINQVQTLCKVLGCTLDELTGESYELTDNSTSLSFVDLRLEAGKTQQQVADAIGVTARTVQNWEAGKNLPELTPVQVADLCDLLNCTVRELADGFLKLCEEVHEADRELTS